MAKNFKSTRCKAMCLAKGMEYVRLSKNGKSYELLATRENDDGVTETFRYCLSFTEEEIIVKSVEIGEIKFVPSEMVDDTMSIEEF